MKSAKEMREISDKGYMYSYQNFLQEIERGITEAAEEGFTSKKFVFYNIYWSDLSGYVDLMTNEMEALGYLINIKKGGDTAHIITISWG